MIASEETPSASRELAAPPTRGRSRRRAPSRRSSRPRDVLVHACEQLAPFAPGRTRISSAMARILFCGTAARPHASSPPAAPGCPASPWERLHQKRAGCGREMAGGQGLDVAKTGPARKLRGKWPKAAPVLGVRRESHNRDGPAVKVGRNHDARNARGDALPPSRPISARPSAQYSTASAPEFMGRAIS